MYDEKPTKLTVGERQQLLIEQQLKEQKEQEELQKNLTIQKKKKINQIVRLENDSIVCPFLKLLNQNNEDQELIRE